MQLTNVNIPKVYLTATIKAFIVKDLSINKDKFKKKKKDSKISLFLAKK